MLSKNKIKLIRSLDSKKQREKYGLFLVEGDKMVRELCLSQYRIEYMAATEEWFEANRLLDFSRCREKDVVHQSEIDTVSFLKNPQNVFCVAEIPQFRFDLADLKDELSLILDTVQDPGNLGTIIRVADWFGIGTIICSTDTADLYNPKVIQSAMGAVARVHVFYRDLLQVLTDIQKLQFPVYGTTLQGENIYSSPLSPNGFILMGNESKGLRKDYHPYLTRELYIPHFPVHQKRSESLNVAIATALVCSEFRRR